MTSYKTAFNLILKASLGILLLASCTKRDPTLSNNGATFYVDTITASVTDDQLSPNDVISRKFINFTACVKDNAQQAAIMSLQFQIKAGDVVVTKSTDERGCLVWQELFSCDGGDDEKQILLSRSVTAIQDHSGTEVVQLAYDPWDPTDKMAFLKREAGRSPEVFPITYALGGSVTRQDAASKQDYSVTVDIRGTLQSENLKVSDVTNLALTDLGRDFSQYEVDQDLNLTIARQYELKFNAGIVRHTFAKGTESDNINSGHFKVYFALLKEGFDATRGLDASTVPFIVSANQTEADAYLGRFIKTATVRFNNVAALSSRMTGVLTLVSTDENSHFAESSFEGILSPISGNSQTIDLIPSKNLNARQLLQIQANYQAQLKSTNVLDSFAQQTGFKLMTSAAASVQVQSGFRKIIQSYDLLDAFKRQKNGVALAPSEHAAFSNALCFKFFDGAMTPALKPAYEECNKNPEKMLFSATRDLVAQVNNPVPQSVGFPISESMVVSANFNFSQANTKSTGHTTNTSLDLTAGVGLSSPTKFGASIGGKFSVGRQWFHTVAVLSAQSESTLVTTTRAVTVLSQGFTFNIDVTSRSCFLILPTAEFASILDAALPGHSKGRYFCDTNLERKTRQEVYYFLNQPIDLSSSPLGDNFSSQDNPWRMFIRGTPTFNMFKSMFGQKGISLQLEQVPDEQLRHEFNSFYMTQEFPGMLTPLN